MAISPTSPLGVRREHRSRRWSGSRVIAGRSRTVSRPPRTSLGSITTRPAPGMVGIVMFRLSYLPSPGWPPSAIRPIGRRPKKPHLARDENLRPYPLVDSGNPSNSAASRAKAHPTRLYHRMVALAPSSSSSSAKSALQKEITTVMLGVKLLLKLPIGDERNGVERPEARR